MSADHFDVLMKNAASEFRDDSLKTFQAFADNIVEACKYAKKTNIPEHLILASLQSAIDSLQKLEQIAQPILDSMTTRLGELEKTDD